MQLLTTALPCEAKPLIHFFGLQSEPGHPYPLYKNDSMALIVTGVHSSSGAAGAAYLAAHLHPLPPLPTWINVGVAGHDTAPIGSAFFAHKITDASSHKSWYPNWIDGSFPTAPLTTVPKVTLQYPEGLVDMEAAGFYPTALKTSCTELVHCLKVVSDTPSQPADRITSKGVTQLINSHLSTLQKALELLEQTAAELREELLPPKDLNSLLSQWHFTATQKNQLKSALIRMEIDQLPLPSFQECKKASEVLHLLTPQSSPCL